MDIIQYNAMHKFVGILDNPQGSSPALRDSESGERNIRFPRFASRQLHVYTSSRVLIGLLDCLCPLIGWNEYLNADLHGTIFLVLLHFIENHHKIITNITITITGLVL